MATPGERAPPTSNRRHRLRIPASKRTVAIASLTVLATASGVGLLAGGSEKPAMPVRSDLSADSGSSSPSTAQRATTTVPGTAARIAPGPDNPARDSPAPGASAPAPAAPPVPEPAAVPETEPAAEVLAEDEVQRIIDATGFHGLRGHRLELAEPEPFQTKTANVIFIRLDGAEPSLPLEQMKANIRVAEALAAERRTYTVPLVFGPGQEPMEVTFTVRPGNLNQSELLDTQYVIFADEQQDLGELAARPAFPDAFTTNNDYGIDVSIIGDRPDTLVHALPANSLNRTVEDVQRAIGIDLDRSFVERYDREAPDSPFLQNQYFPEGTNESNKQSLAHVLRETVAGAWGFGVAAAQEGWTPDQHQLTGEEIRFLIAPGTPSPTGANYRPFLFSRPEYLEVAGRF